MARRTQLQPLRIAIDTGGTFTDCVWMDRGRLRMLKVFSTPDDPSRAIVEALEKIGRRDSLILLHGTTVGTNTLLQRKGARVALVTTAGFEDVIEIGRQARPKLYDFFFDRIEPLVPKDLRFGADERTSCDGEILQEPSPTELQDLKAKVLEKEPEAIAISLLFSFTNPKNEMLVAGAVRDLGMPLSVSHQILPEFREYERTSTVVVNAYLQPVMQRYLESLEARTQAWSGVPQGLKPGSSQRLGGMAEAMPSRSTASGSRSARNAAKDDGSARGAASGNRGPGARIFVMQSSGGITALRSAAREPVRTVLSGPAGGVVGATAMARRGGCERIISFDMGGTSTDVALVDHVIHGGNQTEIAGLPVGVPMLDIHTVGAGGGSIARFDVAGALRVGPESAGADPGPICYGRGTQPTVTDANLILGRLQADRFLGGDFTLDLERARRIISAWLKQQRCTLSLEQFAAGIIRVVNATMEKAIRVVSIERGYDPREFVLVAFGGAGGLHACELAAALRVPRVIVPARPGALSAFGILVSDVVKDYSRTVLWRTLDKLPAKRLNEEFGNLCRQADKDFQSESWPGTFRRQLSVDVRYRGQGYELNIPYTRGLMAAFRREHERRYGYSYPAREIELVTLRVRAIMKSPQSSLGAARVRRTTLDRTGRDEGDSFAERASVFFGAKKITATTYDRDSLQPGRKYSGPAVVTEYSATTIVPPGKHFWLDRTGNLSIQTRL
jgi:N-methylhydantoinase A